MANFTCCLMSAIMTCKGRVGLWLIGRIWYLLRQGVIQQDKTQCTFMLLQEEEIAVCFDEVEGL